MKYGENPLGHSFCSAIKIFELLPKEVKAVKGKAVPLQAWSGPEGSRKFRVPRFHDNGTGRW